MRRPRDSRLLSTAIFHEFPSLTRTLCFREKGRIVCIYTTSNVYRDSRGTVTSVRDTRERRVTFPIDYANHVSGRRGCIFIRLARDWRSDGLEESGTVAKFSTIDGKKRQRREKTKNDGRSSGSRVGGKFQDTNRWKRGVESWPRGTTFNKTRDSLETDLHRSLRCPPATSTASSRFCATSRHAKQTVD